MVNMEQKTKLTCQLPVDIEYPAYMAEIGFTRNEIRRFEKHRLMRRRFVVEFCISSWCLMVVTTRMPKNEIPISIKTQ